MKRIKEIIELLQPLNLIVDYDDCDEEVSNITYDSREVSENTLFFCKGVEFKKEYLLQAINQGLGIYISEIDYGVNINKIIVSDIRIAMLEVARFFYDYPDKKIKLIAVTGTKGKSTTVEFLKNIFDHYLLSNNKKPCGLISGIKIYDGIVEENSTLTTPEAFIVYKHIFNAVKSNMEYMIVEVSSQALKYNRINNAHFDMVAFLNIGLDHINSNEHRDFEDYFSSKLKIFSLSKNVVVNLDSDHLEEILENTRGKKVYTYSMKNLKADIFCNKYEYVNYKNTFYIDSEKYELDILGEYNIENSLCAILIAKHYGIDYKHIYEGLKTINLIGRNNLFISNDKKVIFLVDYAHNYLSFQRVYENFKKHFSEYKIVSIFGASGGKAKNRIKDLSQIASLYSDKIYLVPDDPGNESLEKIQDEMEKYVEKNIPVFKFNSREKAIIDAVNSVKERTIIFVAGKGDEDFQKINGKKEKIKSDLKVVKEMIYNLNK